MNLTDHVGRLRVWMEEHDFDAFLVKGCANVRWLTQFSGIVDAENPHTVVITCDVARFYTDSRYIEAAERSASGTPWEVVCEFEDRIKTVAHDFSEANRIATESSMDVGSWDRFSDAFAGELVVTDRAIEGLRAVKDPDEIEKIRRAQAITDAAFSHMCEWMRTGMTEREIAFELETFMLKSGSDGLAFSSIVASGPNSSLPHAVPSTRRIEKGDLLILDFGAVYEGYRSDMTRTVLFGAASDEQRRIYETVLRANRQAHEACRATMTGADLHRVAQDVIEEAGFEGRFNHGLGHGVGLDIHEQPVASPLAKRELPEGSVLTIEPGIYIPGFGGVRIEDMVIVERDGATNLTASPKELIEL